jgi:hypothetical protein
MQSIRQQKGYDQPAKEGDGKSKVKSEKSKEKA